MTNQQAMYELSKDSEFFKFEAFRIFTILGTKIDINNYIEITIKEISKELQVEEKIITKGIDILEKKKLLVKNKYGFKLNPGIIYRREIEEDITLEDKKDAEYYNKIYEILIEEIYKKENKIDELSKKYNLSEELIYSIIKGNLNIE